MTIPFNVRQDLKDAQLRQDQRERNQQHTRRLEDEMSEDEEFGHWCADSRNFGPDADDDNN